MAMEVLFAGVSVRDFPAAVEWYSRLFNRAADVVAHDHEVMWRVTETGWLYIVEDPDRAGRSVAAISVTDLDAAVAEVTSRGLRAGSIEQEGDAARKATLEDPDGNRVALIEVAG
jgi:predicted enzyme related to lactoylglutathione lyase